jgi:hypothetical protein
LRFFYLWWPVFASDFRSPNYALRLQHLGDSAGGVFQGHGEDAGSPMTFMQLAARTNACADGADCELLAQTNLLEQCCYTM